jgi:hypothetical protein
MFRVDDPGVARQNITNSAAQWLHLTFTLTKYKLSEWCNMASEYWSKALKSFTNVTDGIAPWLEKGDISLFALTSKGRRI